MFNTAIPRISDFATSSSHDYQNKIVNCRPNRSKKNDLLTGEATHTERSTKEENKNNRNVERPHPDRGYAISMRVR